jgi:hypothetical protein
MGHIKLPGQNPNHTELSALNKIITKLIDVRNAIVDSSGGGDASLAEQQLQTSELIDINTELDNILAEITTSLNTANSPSHIQLTDPSAISYTGFKELSFVCSGNITVTLDGNDIIYPFTLGTAEILGSTIKADTASLNAVEFNGTGTVLVTIMK